MLSLALSLQTKQTMTMRIQKTLTLALALTMTLAAGNASAKKKAEYPAPIYGQLAVKGAQLVGQDGQPVQLRGVSFGWHCLALRFYNPSSARALVNDWGANVVRCSIGLDLNADAFNKDPKLGYACVDSIVQGARETGAYVIIDFHSHNNNLRWAKEFFETVSKKYGTCPNVIYELWNEPLKIEWRECKEYAEELIPIIRRNAPKAVILVGTPTWSQDIHLAEADRIEGCDNIMYVLHFYAATHTQYLRDRLVQCVEKGLPVFISECGGMTADGDGHLDPEQWEAWIKTADKCRASWVAWSVHDKDEVCSLLKPTAPSQGEQWKQSDLKPWAQLVRRYLKR